MKLEEFPKIQLLSRRSDVAHGTRQTTNMQTDFTVAVHGHTDIHTYNINWFIQHNHTNLTASPMCSMQWLIITVINTCPGCVEPVDNSQCWHLDLADHHRVSSELLNRPWYAHLDRDSVIHTHLIADSNREELSTDDDSHVGAELLHFMVYHVIYTVVGR